MHHKVPSSDCVRQKSIRQKYSCSTDSPLMGCLFVAWNKPSDLKTWHTFHSNLCPYYVVPTQPVSGFLRFHYIKEPGIWYLVLVFFWLLLYFNWSLFIFYWCFNCNYVFLISLFSIFVKHYELPMCMHCAIQINLPYTFNLIGGKD